MRRDISEYLISSGGPAWFDFLGVALAIFLVPGAGGSWNGGAHGFNKELDGIDKLFADEEQDGSEPVDVEPEAGMFVQPTSLDSQ